MRALRFSRSLTTYAALSAMLAYNFAPIAAQADSSPLHPAPTDINDAATKTPIKHVIVIIGENRSFDHVFAIYQPKKGESIWNLLSEGIVKEDGSPGANYKNVPQAQAADSAAEGYQTSPGGKKNYATLPPALVGGPTMPYFTSVSDAKKAENGLPENYYTYLTTGGTGQTSKTPDKRIKYDGKTATDLPPGPFQLSPGITADDYAASPVHRFYQMWQQLDCTMHHATKMIPSGCISDLFPWVEVTVGAGTNGLPQPKGFNDESTGEGSTSMGFYNMAKGDVPVFKTWADKYAISDNYHQAVSGGTGANHIMMGSGDAFWFSDGKGNPMKPPENVVVDKGTKNAGKVAEVENPNAQPGTNNWYAEDGYGGGSYGSPSYGGGSYSDCSDPSQPGVKAVLAYQKTLPYHPDSRCEKGHYYLLNNYNPGYFSDGSNAYTNENANNTVFTIPPSSTPTIADTLMAKKISWAYYGDQWDRNVQDPYDLSPVDAYCNICNMFQYETAIMTDKAVRTTHLLDTIDLYASIAKGELPAVSFVKPSGFVDGHPASSKLDLFEGFALKIVAAVQANKDLFDSTAIFITFDEGGGYWDSGYVQPVDFFGDGTRIPMIAVSPHAVPGHVSHEYTDHVSILKFIERNWSLPPVSDRSRDNLPDPKVTKTNAYVPTNSPAIGDLFDLFDFGQT